MVRSGSSKTKIEKKITAAKTTSSKSKATKSASSASTTRKTAVKSAKSDEVVTTKRTTSTKEPASKKSLTPAASKTPTGGKSKEISGKPDSAAEGTNKRSSSRTRESAAQAKNQLVPRTPELFEELNNEGDTPSVSILPAIGAPMVERDQIEAELNTPPEFKEPPVHPFGEDQAAASTKASAAVEPEKEVTFSFLGFNDQILEAIRRQKFQKPTRVQALCLPHTLDGKDVAGFAQTGTGKTAVYLLTAAQRLLGQESRNLQARKPHVLVVVPTRELADQVSQDAKKLLGPLNLKSLAVFGGVDVERHVNELNQSVDIVVATPGRLLDLHRSKHLEFDDLQMLVIDECDRMFDMGFIDDVEYVLRHLPAERVQKLLFSATGSEKVKELAFEYLENPEYVETDPVRITPEKISQIAYAVTAEQKFLTLMGHLRANNPECAIIFTNTKVVAEWVGYKLACNGLNAEVLTGDLAQRKRMSLIKKIKDGKCNLLVATDVLSRGLHVANLSHVYNFDIPDDEESFIHRIGRTARAGATGHAITLICDDYGYNMGDVEKLLGFKIPLAEVPPEFLAAEDVSDYPFDETGRVKVFGQTGASTKDGEESHEREPRRERRHEEGRPSAAAGEAPQPKLGRPESTLPHQRREQPSAPVRNQPSAAPQRITTGPTPASGLPVAAAAATSGANGAAPGHHRPAQPQGPRQSAGHPETRGETRGPRQSAHGGSHPHKTIPNGGAASGPTAESAFPRREGKARETIEMAIQAAKKAAAKRQGTGSGTADARNVASNRRSKVTSQIDEIAANVLSTAQERLGGTIGNLQDRFVSRLEENFPRLSETLIRLGFFSKRFTDDR